MWPFSLARSAMGALLGLDERRCAACLRVFRPRTPEALPLCDRCAPLLQRHTGPVCPRCARPSPIPLLCEDCRRRPPPWDALVWHGLYAGPLQELLLRLKFGADFSTLPLLGEFLVRLCADLPADVLVPLPRHPKRLRRRGFNQTMELARVMAPRLGLPLRPQGLIRTRDIAPQEFLSAGQRRENPRGSFAARNLEGQRVLLVDDIMTTGSTLRHAALALRAGGAASILVAVAARTPPPGYRAH